MNLIERALGVALAASLLAGIVWASNAPLTMHRSDAGRLRLAWSARPERIEKCRQATDEEVARLPQHMRQQVVCEGTTAEYRLQVRVDDALVVDRTVHGGGLRRDRRVYVFEELPLVARASTTIDVRLDRIDGSASGTGQASTLLLESLPPHLAIARRLDVLPREVVLVTYDRERRELTIVSH
jgi:hypothetical protein